jgi:predicted phosphohydrolase
MIFGFDLISDLNLKSGEDFDFTGKPTSLFCLIPGNISTDLKVVGKVLRHLSTLYHGIFFIDGSLENYDVISRDNRVADIQKICSGIRNAIYLHNNVVVVDGIAVLGINGWYKNYENNTLVDEFHANCFKYEDISYLEKTIEKLQLHVDVKKIIILSNCVPFKELYYGECDQDDDKIYPGYILYKDTENKVVKWVYGTYKKIVDTTINNINYVNNAKYDREPYYAKRIEITID